jgi:cell division septation protein DedD
MWLLSVGAMPVAAPPLQPAAPAATPATTAPASVAQRPVATPAAASVALPTTAQLFSRYSALLQCGFFSREANAQVLIEKLRAAGFSTLSGREARPGGEYIAVYVIPGADINASIRQLKAAGFDSFPITGP